MRPVNRRAALILAGGAAVWPLLARAEQKAVPKVGFLRSTPAAPFAHIEAAFREGLKEEGFVDGTNVQIVSRYADNRAERLPALAADLLRRGVVVIVGNSQAAEAAKAATRTTPIVFVIADDPVKRGLVASLNRPRGNLTGLTFFGGGKLNAKRLEILAELVPTARTIAVLQDPNWPGSALELTEMRALARSIGRKILVTNASSAAELEPAFAAIARSGAGALVVSGSPVFTSRRNLLTGLVARHKLPAIYDLRDHVEVGGLMSYSASFADAYRQAGIYAGRILKGEKPADMPVLQPSKLELVVNLKTAQALGITIPQSILVRADDVIE